MSVFEAEHPFQLQQVIDHAQRFIAVLSSACASTDGSDDRARVWLTGRAQEIETVLQALVADWQRGTLPERAAVAVISSYLGAMHAGAEQHLGTGLEVACCQSDAACTIPQTSYGEDAAMADTLPGSPAALADSRRPGP